MKIPPLDWTFFLFFKLVDCNNVENVFGDLLVDEILLLKFRPIVGFSFIHKIILHFIFKIFFLAFTVVSHFLFLFFPLGWGC